MDLVDVSVIIPWKPGDPVREAALEHTLKQWPSDWKVIVAETVEPFVKSEAMKVGIAQARGAWIVMADADMIVPDIRLAVKAVQDGAAWAMPMTHTHRLNEEASRKVIDGADPYAEPLAMIWPRLNGRELPSSSWLVEKPFRYTQEAGGCFVAPYMTFEHVPIDSRFRAWGAEDLCQGLALTKLKGPCARIPGVAFHLWHPAQDRPSRYRTTPENQKIVREYETAARRKDPERMWTVVREGGGTCPPPVRAPLGPAPVAREDQIPLWLKALEIEREGGRPRHRKEAGGRKLPRGLAAYGGHVDPPFKLDEPLDDEAYALRWVRA